MNAPWYAPEVIDWQDGLNPLAIPAFREQRNPYAYRALQRPTLYELRNTPGFELALYAAPGTDFAILGATSTYDGFIALPAGAWVVGVSASSAQPEGFSAQITMPNGATVFSQLTQSADLQNASPYYLSNPQGIPDGGPAKLRLINLSPLANLCQLVIWVIQPQ
jgi:hypothetical protein